MNNLLNKNGFFELKKIKHGFGDFYDYFYSKENFLDNSVMLVTALSPIVMLSIAPA